MALRLRLIMPNWGPSYINPSMLAQGKSAGLITRRSLDRNQDMLSHFFFFFFPFLWRFIFRQALFIFSLQFSRNICSVFFSSYNVRSPLSVAIKFLPTKWMEQHNTSSGEWRHIDPQPMALYCTRMSEILGKFGSNSSVSNSINKFSYALLNEGVSVNLQSTIELLLWCT